MKQSPMFRLNWMDVAKGLLIAILTPVLVVIQASLDAGSLTFDWKHIGMAAIGGFIAYIAKNFFTPASNANTPNSDPKPSSN